MTTKAYFFTDDQYLRWTIGTGADNGYPIPLPAWHPFLANGVDAAVNWGLINGKPFKAYFFKGTQYLRWTIGEGADTGYPKPLAGWHPFLANGVDAAVNWGLVDDKPKAYFFKGKYYLRWTIGEGADAGYPRPLSQWHPFLANGVDAAVNWGRFKGKPKAYFFKGNQYLRWTIGADADPGYPKPLSGWHPQLAAGVKAAVNWTKTPTIAITDESAVAQMKQLINDNKRLIVTLEGQDAAKIIASGVLEPLYEPPTAASTFVVGTGAAATGVTAGSVALIAVVGAVVLSIIFVQAITFLFTIALIKGYRIKADWGLGRWDLKTLSFSLPYIDFELIPPQ